MAKRSPIKLESNLFRVVLCDPNTPDDEETWQVLEVQSRTPDLVAAEGLLRRRDKLGVQDAAIRASTYSAFFALKRTKLIDSATTWEQFEPALVESTVIDDTSDTPTEPAPEAG